MEKVGKAQSPEKRQNDVYGEKIPHIISAQNAYEKNIIRRGQQKNNKKKGIFLFSCQGIKETQDAYDKYRKAQDEIQMLYSLPEHSGMTQNIIAENPYAPGSARDRSKKNVF